MSRDVGFTVSADVDAALANLKKFGEAGEDSGEKVGGGLDDLDTSAKRATASVDKLRDAIGRVNRAGLSSAIADMNRYEAAIKAAVAAGAGLPGWGPGAHAGPAGGGSIIPSGGGPAGPSAPGSGQAPSPRAGGGFGMPLTVSGVLRGLGIAYTGYQVAASAFNAVRGAAVEGNDLGIRQDDLWRSMNQPRGNFNDFHKSLASAADNMKTNTAEFTQYLSEFARETTDKPADKLTEGTKAGIGLAVGIGADRSTGVAAIASGLHWSGGKQDSREFAGMLAFALKQAGVVQQGGAMLSKFAEWQAQTGARGGPVNNAGWWDMIASLNKGDMVGRGVSGANLLNQLDAGFRSSKHNPAMMAFMSSELKKRNIDLDTPGLENLLEGGIAAPVDESGTTSLRVFMEGMAKRPFSSINARGQALRDAFSLDSIAQGKAIISAFERPGMDAKKQDMLTRYIGSKQGDKEFRSDAIPDIASFLSGATGDITEGDFRKRADEIAKQGRTPTPAQAYSDTAASAESGKLQMGWEMRDLVLLKKTLDDFAWKEMLEATTGAKDGINSLIEKINGLGETASGAFNEFLDNLSKSPGRNNARKWLGLDEQDGGIEKMSYPGDMMDRGLLQSAAVGQMMMVSMRGGMPGAGGMMHAALSGMPSGGGRRRGGKAGKFGLSPDLAAHLAKVEGEYGIPKGLLTAIAKVESGFNPNAVSSAGAEGMFQIMPGTQKDLGVGNPWDPYEASIGAAKHLARDYRSFGDWNKAITAYNAGPGNVRRGRLKQESIDYLPKVLGAWGNPPPQGELPPASPPAQAPSATNAGPGNVRRGRLKQEFIDYLPKVLGAWGNPPPQGELPPASPPAQAPSATGTDVEIRLHLKDKEGNPVTTDPPKTIVRLRTRGLAPNAPLGWA
jgi:hypothetical protein